MSHRDSFVERFGENNALRVEAAADGHRDPMEFGRDRGGKGTDPFRWAILVAISCECISKPAYAKWHGITCPDDGVEAWLMEPEQRQWLSEHDGDMDYLALLGGRYNRYMPESTTEPDEPKEKEAV